MSDSAFPWTLAHQAFLSMRVPGNNTGVGCHSLLQGIFPTQGSNLGLLHYRQILYHLRHQGSKAGRCLPCQYSLLFSVPASHLSKFQNPAQVSSPWEKREQSHGEKRDAPSETVISYHFKNARFWFMFKVNLGTGRLGFQKFPAPENLSARGALLSWDKGSYTTINQKGLNITAGWGNTLAKTHSHSGTIS